MKNVLKVLSELSFHELMDLKNNLYLLDEVINQKGLTHQRQTSGKIISYLIDGRTRVSFPADKIITNRYLAEQILKQDGLMFDHLSPELKKDPILIKIAAQKNPEIIGQIFPETEESVKRTLKMSVNK